MKKRIDLIFCSVNKHSPNMTFDIFLQALIKIGQFKYPKLNASQGLQTLVVTHMLPLCERIQESQQTAVGGNGGVVYDIRFDELVALVMRDVGSILLEIYIAHFPHEVKGN